MNGEVRQIQPAELAGILENLTMREEYKLGALEFAPLSYPMYVGTYADEVLCILGLIPPTLLSDTAYLWMVETPAVRAHPVVFGRHAHRVIAKLRKIYPRIIGHCDKKSSIAWLQSLGATFTDSASYSQFEILTW